MQWLYPAGAWGLVSLALITALYLLKRRSESVTVPSLLLWQRAVAEQQAMRPFQKLKKNILYFLQMLLALLLVVALMRPALSGGVQGETVLVFDLSASMQAVENGDTRLQTAQRRALSLLDGMREGDRVTILAAGAQVETPLSRSGDLTRARGVIEGLRAQNGGADLAAAVSLAQAMARDIEGLNIIVFSDTYEAQQPVQTVRTGAGAENRALLSLSASQDGQVFARVANYGQAADITVACEADGALCDAVGLSLAAGETRAVLLHAPAEAQTIMAEIWEEDALAADNRRWYVDRGQSAYRAALCGENVFVEKAVLLRDDITLLRTTAEEAAALTDIDLYIYDGELPETLPQTGALLCVAPNSAVFGITPGEKTQPAGSLRAGYTPLARQLCENLLLDDIALRVYTPLTGGESVLTLDGQALVSVAEQNHRRAAVLSFDLHDSNLPMKGDYPILMQNLLRYLLPDARQALGDDVCGQRVALPREARAERTSVILPSGRALSADDTLEDTNEQGVYTLRYEYADGSARTVRFTLHMDPAESDVLTVGGAGMNAVAARTQAAAGQEMTLWVLLAFLCLLLVEWGVSRRVA